MWTKIRQITVAILLSSVIPWNSMKIACAGPFLEKATACLRSYEASYTIAMQWRHCANAINCVHWEFDRIATLHSLHSYFIIIMLKLHLWSVHLSPGKGHCSMPGICNGWTGILDWRGGLEYWTGEVDWSTGLERWTGVATGLGKLLHIMILKLFETYVDFSSYNSQG